MRQESAWSTEGKRKRLQRANTDALEAIKGMVGD
jgi:hypothetical protein